MVTYSCRNCRYRFVPKTNKAPVICPYCSKQGTIEIEKDAAAILKESSEF